MEIDFIKLAAVIGKVLATHIDRDEIEDYVVKLSNYLNRIPQAHRNSVIVAVLSKIAEKLTDSEIEEYLDRFIDAVLEVLVEEDILMPVDNSEEYSGMYA